MSSSKIPRLHRPRPLRHSSRNPPDFLHEPLRRHAHLLHLLSPPDPLTRHNRPNRLRSRSHPLRLRLCLQRLQSRLTFIQRCAACGACSFRRQCHHCGHWRGQEQYIEDRADIAGRQSVRAARGELCEKAKTQSRGGYGGEGICERSCWEGLSR